VLALAAILLLVRLLPEGKGQPVAWEDLSSRVGPLTFANPDHRVFRKRAELTRYLRAAQAARPAPEIDFSSRQVLLVSPGPRSSSGYAVQVLSARKRGQRISVRLREQTPRVGADVRARVTYPYLLISLPADGEVYVDWPDR
jgi:PrcB C-terminal